MTGQPATPAHYCPACGTTTPAPQATAEAFVQAGADHQAECTGPDDLRQHLRTLDLIQAEHDEQPQHFRANHDLHAPRLLEIAQALRAELDRLRAELATASGQLRAIALVRVWRNEDGREFMFADDIRTALGVPTRAVSAPTD